MLNDRNLQVTAVPSYKQNVHDKDKIDLKRHEQFLLSQITPNPFTIRSAFPLTSHNF